MPQLRLGPASFILYANDQTWPECWKNYSSNQTRLLLVGSSIHLELHMGLGVAIYWSQITLPPQTVSNHIRTVPFLCRGARQPPPSTSTLYHCILKSEMLCKDLGQRLYTCPRLDWTTYETNIVTATHWAHHINSTEQSLEGAEIVDGQTNPST